MTKISVVHPTARIAPPYPSFPRGWVESVEAFAATCDHPEDIEYILVVHGSNLGAFYDHAPETNEGRVKGWGFGAFRIVCNEGVNTGVGQGNAGAAAATSNIIVGGMDDLFPPAHWDTLISGMLEGQERLPRVLHVSSGSPLDDEIFIPQIYTRERYLQLGYAGHPTYESMFCDNEFTEHARRDGIVIDAMHIKFEHRHPAFGTAETDSVYQGENRAQAYLDGQANFEHRKRLGFPRESVTQYGTFVPDTVAFALPGERFGVKYVFGLINLLLTLTARNVNLRLVQCYTSNVHCTRIELADQVLKMEPRPDFVLWIDDDNSVAPEQFEALMQDLREHPELDGVVGWCWCDHDGDPQRPFMMSCGRQSEDMVLMPFHPDDIASGAPVVPIDWSGFPVVLMRTGVLETLGARSFVPIVRDDVKFGFVSEDASFFWRARQAGLKFAVDLRCKVPHMKTRAIEPQWIPQSQFEKLKEEKENVGVA
jgi:hypothetical protein